MEDRIYLTELYDYYQGLLTDKQKTYFEEYYFDNLTMEEIAENHEISKNAVSKTLIEIKEKLDEYEDILKLYDNRLKITKLLSEEELNKIDKYI
ncbi:MAG TPA: sigma factor-like helix-turn-helix DNA-binding protein [Bacilli bacterium]|jgi:predicted DNA-binding protein YlxM (UPF0122 family)|nr:sigma factor-like helix-turn-helix DNA-binding protein [Bacilli bacterium]HQC83470.1 sigma factor-like helix-turn-helix DNA-binding protein [Bacilli bacterium]